MIKKRLLPTILLYAIMLLMPLSSYSSNKIVCSNATIREIKGLIAAYLPHNVPQNRLDKLKCETLNEQLKKIDSHTQWFLPDRYIDPFDEKKQIAGIGAILIQKGNSFWIAPYKDTPLYKKVKKRIRLISINNIKVKNKTYKQVSKLLSGKAQSIVKITFINNKKVKTIRIKRTIYTPSIYERYENRKNVRIRIMLFEPYETADFILSELDYIKETGKNLVIDLRDCSGGDLYESLDSASLFLKPGKILAYLKMKNGIKIVTAPSDIPTFNIKPTILIGADTASAAEIFTGILQYYKAARVVGEKSYGKCNSQSDFYLSDNSVLRLTNIEVLLPNKTSCENRGILPDKYRSLK